MQWVEIVKIRQFPLQLEQNGKSKIFFLLKLSTNVKKLPKLDFDREIQVRMGCSLLRPPLEMQFAPFSTLSRQNSSLHQKSKSTRNNFLPNSVFFIFKF